MKRDPVRKWLTIIGVGIIILLCIKYIVQQRWELLFGDIFITLLGIWLFNRFWRHCNLDNKTYGIFLVGLILHASYLYPYSPLGIRWDHYMHFYGGFVIAMIGYRIFLKEKWSSWKLFLILLLFTLGVGAFHEIVEWLGYGILGEGEGFLFFGEGDEGEWRNAMLDLIFNCTGMIVAWFTTRFTHK